MIWKWSDRVEPRPNVKVHPLDVHALPKRLRGDVDEEEHPEAVLVYALAAFIVWGVVALIWMAI